MANGLFAGGNGTAENPYLIEDAFDLDAIRNDLTAHYKLINDVDLDTPPFNEGEGWRPIDGFNGYLDGDGYKIKNLFINRPEQDEVGFLSRLNNSRIERIIFECNIT